MSGNVAVIYAGELGELADVFGRQPPTSTRPCA